MAGAAVKNESNIKEELELREESEGEDCQSLDSSSNLSFLSELNLLIVFLSLISPNSNDEEQDNELMKAKDLETKSTYGIARSSVRKKDLIEAKPEGRRASQRFHTTIKDHRHGRKM